MDAESLQHAIDTIDSHISIVKVQLSENENQVDDIKERLRPPPFVNDFSNDIASVVLSLNKGDTDVEVDPQDVQVSNKRSQVFETTYKLLQDRLAHQSTASSVSEQVISSLKTSVQRLNVEKNESLATSARSHAPRVIVFTGRNCAISSLFAIAPSTTFADLLDQVCSFWNLDINATELYANISPMRVQWTAHSFEDGAMVLDQLELLRADHSKGYGQNGQAFVHSAHHTDGKPVTDLPPLYLKHDPVKRTKQSEHLGTQISSSIPDVDLKSAVEIFDSLDVGNTESLTYGQFHSFVLKYFEGRYIPHDELRDAFDAMAILTDNEVEDPRQGKNNNTLADVRLFKDAPTETLHKIPYTACLKTLQRLQISIADDDTMLESGSSVTSPRRNESVFDEDTFTSPSGSGGGPSARRVARTVFQWMLGFEDNGDFVELETLDRTQMRTDYGTTYDEFELLSYDMFHNAIISCIPACNQDLTTQFWVDSFGKPYTQTVDQREFEDGWPFLESIRVSTTDQRTVGSYLEMPLIRFRQLMDRSGQKVIDVTVPKLAIWAGYDFCVALVVLILMICSVYLFEDVSQSHRVYSTFNDGVAKRRISLVSEDSSQTAVLSSFETLRDIDQYWQWINQPLRNYLFSGQRRSKSGNAIIAGYNEMVPSVVTFRQLRSKLGVDVCEEAIDESVPEFSVAREEGCVPPYSLKNRDTQDITPIQPLPPDNLELHEAFEYHDKIFDATFSSNETVLQGKFGSYESTGYAMNIRVVPGVGETVQDVADQYTRQLELLADLGWIDRQTRAVVLSMVFLNRMESVYFQLEFLAEFDAGGSNDFSFHFSILDPAPHQIQLALRWTAAVLMIVSTFVQNYLLEQKHREENKRTAHTRHTRTCQGFLRKIWHKIKRTAKSWHVMYNVACSIALIVCCVMTQQYNSSTARIDIFQSSPTSVWQLNTLAEVYNRVILWNGLCLFMLMIKFTSVMTLQRSLSRYVKTMEKSARSIWLFYVLYLTLTLIFACIFNLWYGSLVKGFATFSESVASLMITTIGLPGLFYRIVQRVPNALSIIFYVIYLLIASFLVRIMFLAAINGSYFLYQLAADIAKKECLPEGYNWNMSQLLGRMFRLPNRCFNNGRRIINESGVRDRAQSYGMQAPSGLENFGRFFARAVSEDSSLADTSNLFASKKPNLLRRTTGESSGSGSW